MDFENMIYVEVPIDKYLKSNGYSDFITSKFVSRTTHHTLKPTIHKVMSEKNFNENTKNQRSAFSPTDLGFNNQLTFSNVAINRRYNSDFDLYTRLITPAKFVTRKRDNSVMEKLNKMNLNEIRSEDNLSAKQRNLPRIIGFTKKGKVQANTLSCSSLSNYYLMATPLKFKRSHAYISMNLLGKEAENIKILNNFSNKENWTQSNRISDIDIQLREKHLDKERDILNRELKMLAKEMVNLGIEVIDKAITRQLEIIIKQLKFDTDFIEVQVFLRRIGNPDKDPLKTELREISKKKIVKKIMVKEEVMKIIREHIIKIHKESIKEL